MRAATRALPSRPAVFAPDRLVGVVLAAGGYPDDPETKQAITGVEGAAAEPGALVFHAGPTMAGGELVTSGGRVLTVVGRGATYQQAIDRAYRAAARIRFENMQYRSDIGKKPWVRRPDAVRAQRPSSSAICCPALFDVPPSTMS